MEFEVEESKVIPIFDQIAKDPVMQEIIHRPTRVELVSQELAKQCPTFEYVRRYGALPPKQEIAPISLAEVVEEPRVSRWNVGLLGKIANLIV